MNSARLQQVRPTFHFLVVRDARPLPRRKSFEDLIAPYAVRDDSNWPVARAYLNETRKIDAAIVDRHRGADD